MSNRQHQIKGLIASHNLTEWWLSTFSEAERQYMSGKYQPMGSPTEALTQGNIFSDQPTTEFLNGFLTWFRSGQDKYIAEQIHMKIVELGQRKPIDKPGYYNGRHFTTFVTNVKNLKRQGRLDEMEALLLHLVLATEAEDQVEKLGVAPWYYEELAKIYRKQKNYEKEISILSRFINQRHGPGAKHPRLKERLEKTQTILDNSK